MATRNEPDNDTARADREKRPGSPPDPQPATAADPRFLVVGVGASAGGLEALRDLLDPLGEETGMALVIVQHRSKASDATMFERLLQSHSPVPVATIEDGLRAAPDHLYVAPPESLVGLMDGSFRILGPHDGREMPIDFFLRSLAADVEDRAAAVVLSGSNSDGTLGARDIREEGGLVLAQDPETAAFPTMPRSVIDEGLADRVLRPAEMAEELAAYAQALRTGTGAAVTKRALPESGREKLLFIVRQETGHNFSNYKPGTVDRRIQRRMHLHRIDRLPDYVQYVRERPAEARALFRDLLIEVTHFFRDPEAFEALGAALAGDYLPHLASPQVRAWVAGCATGEEAYSVAMVLRETMEASEKQLPATVYATDLDADAIRRARAGVYPKNVTADLSAERVERFLVPDGSWYRVRKEIREMVVFAEQNVLQDPPFSHLDLVCCRNLLIYLRPEAQRELLSRFRFALKDGGLLFLGRAESVSPLADAFEEADRSARLFRRIPTGDSRRIAPAPLPRYRTHRTPSATGKGRAPAGAAGPPPSLRSLRQVAERFVLETCAPPSVLVDRQGNVHYIHGRTGAYLELPPGEPSNHLSSMAREGLRPGLAAALGSATTTGEERLHRAIPVTTSGERRYVDVHVRPVSSPELDQDYYMVSFVEAAIPPEPALTGEGDRAPDERRVLDLEGENALLRTELASMVEQYETAHEEFQSSNEELESANEELQSSNEELETAKEELESVNEEQSTLNAELQSKVDELSRVRDDMANLLASTDVATLFLDEELKIKRFTPALERIMSPQESDIGRHLDHLAVRLEGEHLAEDAAGVLRTLNTTTKEVRGQAGTWYQMRIQPYRTVENVIDGVVITFTDVSALKESEQAAQLARELAESVVDTVREPLLVLDGELRVESANRAFYHAFQVARSETVGRKIYELGNRQWDLPRLRELLEEVIPGQREVRGFAVEHEFPQVGRKSLVLDARQVACASGVTRLLITIREAAAA